MPFCSPFAAPDSNGPPHQNHSSPSAWLRRFHLIGRNLPSCRPPPFPKNHSSPSVWLRRFHLIGRNLPSRRLLGPSPISQRATLSPSQLSSQLSQLLQSLSRWPPSRHLWTKAFYLVGRRPDIFELRHSLSAHYIYPKPNFCPEKYTDVGNKREINSSCALDCPVSFLQEFFAPICVLTRINFHFRGNEAIYLFFFFFWKAILVALCLLVLFKWSYISQMMLFFISFSLWLPC